MALTGEKTGELLSGLLLSKGTPFAGIGTSIPEIEMAMITDVVDVMGRIEDAILYTDVVWPPVLCILWLRNRVSESPLRRNMFSCHDCCPLNVIPKNKNLPQCTIFCDIVRHIFLRAVSNSPGRS
jgi:hypothetical protein